AVHAIAERGVGRRERRRTSLRLGERGELLSLRLDAPLELFALLRDVLEALAVQAQRVRVGLHAYLDRPTRLVRVDVVERGERDPRALDDAVDDAVGRCVVAALEAAEVEQGDVRMARRELRRPDLHRAVRRVVLGPDVVDAERVFPGLEEA